MLHLDVWLGSKYTSDLFKERPNCKKLVKELFLGMTQLRLTNNFYEISENSTEKWFSSQLFSVSFVRNPEAEIRDVS